MKCPFFTILIHAIIKYYIPILFLMFQLKLGAPDPARSERSSRALNFGPKTRLGRLENPNPSFNSNFILDNNFRSKWDTILTKNGLGDNRQFESNYFPFSMASPCLGCLHRKTYNTVLFVRYYMPTL